MKNIKRLRLYLEKAQQRVKETSGAKKEFFEREARKTTVKIERLTK